MQNYRRLIPANPQDDSRPLDLRSKASDGLVDYGGQVLDPRETSCALNSYADPLLEHPVEQYSRAVSPRSQHRAWRRCHRLPAWKSTDRCYLGILDEL